MVSSIAIPSIIGVIMAVETSKGISNKLIKIAKMASGKTFGIKTKMVVFKLPIKNHKHKKATKNAAKNDLNCVSKINLLSWANTTANPLIFKWYSLVSNVDLKVLSISNSNCSSWDVFISLRLIVMPAELKSSANNLKKLLSVLSTEAKVLLIFFSEILDWNKTGDLFSKNDFISTIDTGAVIIGLFSNLFWKSSNRFIASLFNMLVPSAIEISSCNLELLLSCFSTIRKSCFAFPSARRSKESVSIFTLKTEYNP